MRAPQQRARPRKSSHETTGTLSIARSGVPHAGQCEPGRTTLSSRGTRWMTTFTKLPQTEPQANANARSSQGVAAQGPAMNSANVTG